MRLILSLLWLALPAFTQDASQPNEGSNVTYDTTNNVFTFSWWGRSGKSYFIQHTDDFVTWGYYPVIIVGQDAVASMNFQTTATRYFLRLEIEADLFNTDTDGDGIPDGWEVQYGLNPRNPSDASADPDGDGFTNLEEYVLGLNPLVNEYGNGVRTQIYTYDSASRVTLVGSNLGETFTYDDEGNLTNSQ